MCLRVNELRYGSKSGLKRIFVWGRVFVTEKLQRGLTPLHSSLSLYDSTTGNCRRTVVPFPGMLSTRIFP